jgi:hypothetical protein
VWANRLTNTKLQVGKHPRLLSDYQWIYSFKPALRFSIVRLGQSVSYDPSTASSSLAVVVVCQWQVVSYFCTADHRFSLTSPCRSSSFPRCSNPSQKFFTTLLSKNYTFSHIQFYIII